MGERAGENFNYIPFKRYIIEIKDEETGRVHLSKRINTRKMAETMKSQYNSLKALVARIFDTKTGEVI